MRGAAKGRGRAHAHLDNLIEKVSPPKKTQAPERAVEVVFLNPIECGLQVEMLKRHTQQIACCAIIGPSESVFPGGGRSSTRQRECGLRAEAR